MSQKIIPVILTMLIFSCNRVDEPVIHIHYLGHSSFAIDFDGKISVLTDYGKPNAYFEYGWDSPISSVGHFIPTIVTYSHSHDDHFDSTRIPEGVRYILKNSDSLSIGDLSITPIVTKERESITNTSFLFDYKEIKILHLGDCQENIIKIDSVETRNYLEANIPSGCDVVLVPIEGVSKFIPQVEKFIDLIRPSVVIPMHYWSGEYKSEFLNYMKGKAAYEKKKYTVLILGGAEYNYVKSERSDSTLILDIKRDSLR